MLSVVFHVCAPKQCCSQDVQYPGSSWVEQITVLLQKAPAAPYAPSCLTKSSGQQQGNISLSFVTYYYSSSLLQVSPHPQLTLFRL